jgi:hypothetical protein
LILAVLETPAKVEVVGEDGLVERFSGVRGCVRICASGNRVKYRSSRRNFTDSKWPMKTLLLLIHKIVN